LIGKTIKVSYLKINYYSPNNLSISQYNANIVNLVRTLVMYMSATKRHAEKLMQGVAYVRCLLRVCIFGVRDALMAVILIIW